MAGRPAAARASMRRLAAYCRLFQPVLGSSGPRKSASKETMTSASEKS